MAAKVCIISGVGPGTGSAVARRFAGGGYTVAMLARDHDRLRTLEKQQQGCIAYPCDVTDEQQVNATVAKVKADLGAAAVLVHNAVAGTFGNFLEIAPRDLEQNFRVNTMGFLYLARAVAPDMVAAGAGAIVASGNTSALRGKANFAGFAPTKAAQRILAESMARELGPKGIHVAYVVIDAVIDLTWTRQMMKQRLGKDAPDEFFIRPSAIADEIWHVVHQERSAWSFNVEVRPFGETW
jgi:short-subunit dehydrogenase